MLVVRGKIAAVSVLDVNHLQPAASAQQMLSFSVGSWSVARIKLHWTFANLY